MATRPQSPAQPIVNRLQRIEGQVRGIQRMVREQRDATELLMQISAVLAATRRLAGVIAEEALADALQADGAEIDERTAAIIEAFSRLD